MNRLIIFSILLGLSLPAHAKLFRSTYLSFELPPNWNCKLEGTEHVCTSKYSQKAKEAIIILTAKEVGPADNIAAYMAHLKTPQNLSTKSGSQPSKVLTVKQRNINGGVWVDGMHLSSEAKDYYTRYLATIKSPIAVLVTFSAHKQHYTKYSRDFQRAIDSLNVVIDKKMFAEKPSDLRSPNQPIGQPIGQHMPVSMEMEEFPEEGSSGIGDFETKLIGLALLFAAIGFYFLRRKKG